MLRANNQTIIGTQGCVYRYPTLRNLIRTNYCLDSMAVNRPQSDIDRGISISIASMSAPASEQCVNWSVTLADASAFVTGLTGVSGIDFNNFNLFPNCYASDCGEQLEIRYSVDLPVGFLVELTFQSPAIMQFLNGNATVEMFCQSDYLPCGLEALGLGEVGFVVFQLGQALFCPVRTLICNALQSFSLFTNIPLFIADFPSQIELSEYSSIMDNGNCCQVRRTDINTQNILSSDWFWKVFLENSLDNPRTILFKKHNGFEIPTIFEEGIESLPTTILFDGQSEPFSFNQSNSKHWIASFGLVKPIIPFSQSYSDFLKFNIKHPFFLTPDFSSCSLDNLGRESSYFTDRGVGYAM